MANDPTAATPVANVPNFPFYHRFLGVARGFLIALVVILIALAVFVV